MFSTAASQATLLGNQNNGGFASAWAEPTHLSIKDGELRRYQSEQRGHLLAGEPFLYNGACNNAVLRPTRRTLWDLLTHSRNSTTGVWMLV